jgi:hypothetical protein
LKRKIDRGGSFGQGKAYVLTGHEPICFMFEYKGYPKFSAPQ